MEDSAKFLTETPDNVVLCGADPTDELIGVRTEYTGFSCTLDINEEPVVELLPTACVTALVRPVTTSLSVTHVLGLGCQVHIGLL